MVKTRINWKGNLKARAATLPSTQEDAQKKCTDISNTMCSQSLVGCDAVLEITQTFAGVEKTAQVLA